MGQATPEGAHGQSSGRLGRRQGCGWAGRNPPGSRTARKCFPRGEASLALLPQEYGQEGKGSFSSLSKKSEMIREEAWLQLSFYGLGRGKLRP